MSAAHALHTAVLPEKGSDPASWTLAEWQGLLEELHYQADNQDDETFTLAHEALRWLVTFFLARRLND